MPVSVIQHQKPVWSTPDFNPNAEKTFTPYSIIVAGISAPTQAAINQLYRDMKGIQPTVRQPVLNQTMESTQGMVQLPNGKFVTPEQYQKLMEKLRKRK